MVKTRRPKRLRVQGLSGLFADEKNVRSQPSTGELEYHIQFDLTIDEGPYPVMDSTVDQIQQQARTILEDGGEEIVDDARAIVPVRTGALRDSIYAEVEDVDGMTLGANRPYAKYVEQGTERMSPRPFLQPVIDDHQPMLQGELDEMIASKLAEDMDEDDPELEFDVEMESIGE